MAGSRHASSTAANRSSLLRKRDSASRLRYVGIDELELVAPGPLERSRPARSMSTRSSRRRRAGRRGRPAPVRGRTTCRSAAAPARRDPVAEDAEPPPSSISPFDAGSRRAASPEATRHAADQAFDEIGRGGATRLRVAASRTPASSNDSRIAATQNARPPCARPSSRLAVASSMPSTSACVEMARSASSTAPPGKTYAPATNTERRLRRSMKTSMPAGGSVRRGRA